MLLLPKILGVIGFLLILRGLFEKRKEREDLWFLLGGVGLLAYSISLRDPIFVPLQIIFILASAYELYVAGKK